MEKIIEAQQALVKLSSFAKNNQGVNLPNTEQEYSEYAESLMELIRDNLK